MKQKLWGFLALMLPLVAATSVAFGFSPVEAEGILSLCVDWTIGFTGHMDGIAMATVSVVGLKQKRAAALAEMKKIHEAAGDNPLDEDQQRSYDEHKAQAEALRARIEQAEEVEQFEEDLNRRSAVVTVETDPGSDARVTEGVDKHWRRRTVRYFNALAMRKENEQVAARMMASVVTEAREISQAQVRDEEKEALEIISRSGLPHRRQMELRAVLGLAEFRLMTTTPGDNQGGDHLLPKPFLAQIFVLTEEYGAARRLFRILPFSGPGNTMDLKNVVGKVLAYWVDQGELIPPSDWAVGPGQLQFHKLAGITSWTTETEEDSAFNVIPIVQEQFAEAFAEKEDEAGFIGDGTATYGGYTGILNLPDVTVVQTEGQTGAVTEATLRAVKSSVSQRQRRNARWAMHESVMDEIRQLESSAGIRLFTESLAEGGSVNLLGYPVTFVDVYPSVSAVSGAETPFLSFGDHSRMLMGIKRGMTADISREGILQNPANGDILYNAYQADGALLRTTERVGFVMPAAWQPAITVLKTASGSG